MQPYFFPYIGYFQLIAAVDLFIVYDNIKYTKKGWINRNRMLQNGKDVMFSLPLKRDSDYLDVCLDCHLKCCHLGDFQTPAIKPRVCRITDKTSYWCG